MVSIGKISTRLKMIYVFHLQRKNDLIQRFWWSL